MVRKSRQNAKFIERVKKDLEILNTGLELGGAETEESGSPTTFPEDLSRKELVTNIVNSRDGAMDCIKLCNSADIADITQGLLDQLLKIDLFNPKALHEIRELRRRAEHLEQELPVNFSLYHSGTMSFIGFVPVKLSELENLCSNYQEKFGGN